MSVAVEVLEITTFATHRVHVKNMSNNEKGWLEPKRLFDTGEEANNYL